MARERDDRHYFDRELRGIDTRLKQAKAAFDAKVEAIETRRTNLLKARELFTPKRRRGRPIKKPK